MASLGQMPAEIVRRICQLVYLECIPYSVLSTLDPYDLPPPEHFGQPVTASVDETRSKLYALCLVNRAFYREAQPLLYRRVQVTLPYRFMLLLEPALDAPPMLPLLRSLDFSTFRAMGLRRTVGESHERRFVTPERLLELIAGSTGLVAFGASENMDSALSLDVLEALLLREGGSSKPARMRAVSRPRGSLREEYNALQSLDLCGCVSAVFVQAMSAFVQKYLASSAQILPASIREEEEDGDDANMRAGSDEDTRGRSRGRSPVQEHARAAPRASASMKRGPRQFPMLQRLGLAGVTLSRDVLTPFVLAFPNLTHLDLSKSRTDARLLDCLGGSSVRLESISLARCRALTSQSITQFLVDAPATTGLEELSLEGTLLFPTPLSTDDLRVILTKAPCMRHGRLRYLDLSGCPITDEELALILPQPALLDFGLSSCPSISLARVRDLLLTRAPNVQILDISHSAGATSPAGFVHAVNLYHDLIAPCTQKPHAISIAQQLHNMGLSSSEPVGDEPWSPPTNLRVIELATQSLYTIRGGFGAWRVIWGAGRRGWVVDTAAAPRPEAELPEELDDTQLRRTREPLQIPSLHRTSSMKSHEARFANTSPDRKSLRRAPSVERRGRSEAPTGAARMHSRSLSRGGMSFPGKDAALSSPRGRARETRQSRTPQRGLPSALESRSLSLYARAEDRPAEDDEKPVSVRPQVIRGLDVNNPRRTALERLAAADGNVQGSVGWHSHKMEVLLGYGMLGREIGIYAWFTYQVT